LLLCKKQSLSENPKDKGFFMAKAMVDDGSSLSIGVSLPETDFANGAKHDKVALEVRDSNDDSTNLGIKVSFLCLQRNGRTPTEVLTEVLTKERPSLTRRRRPWV
jgi:hypothetical protein